MFQLIHIFLFCNTALCHIIQSFFPACSQFRVQKLSDGAVYHIKDHLSKKGWSDHLGFLIECQIFDIAQFLKNFRSGGTGSDSAAFNLGTKLFVLDQLTCRFFLYPDLPLHFPHCRLRRLCSHCSWHLLLFASQKNLWQLLSTLHPAVL